MTKLFALVLVTLLVAALAACGPKTPQNGSDTTSGPENTIPDSSQSGQSNPAQTETTESSVDTSGEITVESLMNREANPESDFDFIECAEGEAELAGYYGDSEIVVITETWTGLKVTKIQSYVFGAGSIVKAVKIPDSVTLVNDFAFATNTNLEIVVFGGGVKEIGTSAFQSCENLRELILNDGLEKIGEVSIGGCSNLKKLVIPESVNEIHILAFIGCPSDFVVVGKAGSVAETYAKDNGITFEAN